MPTTERDFERAMLTPGKAFGRSARAVDSLMSDPEVNALLLRLSLSAGTKDQYQAAVNQAVILTVRAIQSGFLDIGGWDHPEWVRDGAFSTLSLWATNTASTCQHCPSPSRPAALYGAAWKPRLVACEKCTHLFVLPGKGDLTCDGCGVITGGPDEMSSSIVRLGMLTWMFGICRDCRY